jgi:hypothetical protein
MMSAFGSKNRNLRGFSPAKEVLKPIFILRCPGLPHNLGYFLYQPGEEFIVAQESREGRFLDLR